MDLLIDIILILFLAVAIIVVMAKFRISPIIGFLITGILIGPSAFNLINSIDGIQILAEIGIIILMFTIGLEFSISKIKSIKNYFITFGGSQVMATWIVFFILLSIYGLSIYQAIFGGFLLSLSSTAIIFKILQDNNEVTTPYGSKTSGVLLFQDAAIIPFFIILPIMLETSGVSFSELSLKMLISIGGITGIFLFGKFLTPKIFTSIIKMKIPELLMVSVIVFIFGAALIAHSVGSSVAMGAFIAGVALSDSNYAHHINSQIIPSKHIFNSIFFISIGLFINLDFFFFNIFEIVLITAIIIIVKVVIVYLIFIFLKYPKNEGIITAFSLANLGEFAFILLAVAQQNIIFSNDTHQILLSCTVLSMLTIPMLIKIGKKLSEHKSLKLKITEEIISGNAKNHTIIAGFGINGQNIARVLKTLNIPYTILETNPITVSNYKKQNEPIHYGDIANNENLIHLGIEKATLMIIAISDIDAVKRTIKLAKSINPELKIIARSNFFNQVEEMYKLGADLVLSQDIETSLVTIQHVLKFYNMPEYISRNQVNLLRNEHYQFFISEKSRQSWKNAIFDFINHDSELFFITPGSNHINKKINKLEPFTYKNMKILGIIRNSQILSNFSGETELEESDTLIFSGNHKEVSNAVLWMEDNK